ncbi:hypothetical protein ACFO5X_07265 [Seohaeicola nanhaiensis]|uniref:Helix-turn-helix domain-containing protein n=1 Tax=Seohaeicola nanhaiensis TaxID=1387282 RepID=A0ABV9KE39_9RHOB
MQGLTASQLADRLNLSKGRISQLVASGRLEGCYSGDNRARRFDLKACADALSRKLDPGQLLGNGAETKQRIAALQSSIDEDSDDDAPPAREERKSDLLPSTDPGRYELARIQKVEEEARRLRRANAEAEGTVVLASAVHRQVAQLIGQEVAEFETVLRDAARKIADRMGVDYRTARQIMIETWRDHRKVRTEKLTELGDAVQLTAEERGADI